MPQKKSFPIFLGLIPNKSDFIKVGSEPAMQVNKPVSAWPAPAGPAACLATAALYTGEVAGSCS